jgi:L-amino acid N-acyltransferase YncA
MNQDITIRNAEYKDLQLIVDIYNSTIASRMVTADLEPISVESRSHWFNEHSPDARPLWIIDYKGETCGWVSFQSFYGRPAYNATAEISIYFHQNFRGKGIGKEILERAIKACPQLHIKTLLGFIFGHNEPSLRLFAAYGFKKWAHLPNIAELDGIERDLIIMGKRI